MPAVRQEVREPMRVLLSLGIQPGGRGGLATGGGNSEQGRARGRGINDPAPLAPRAPAWTRGVRQREGGTAVGFDLLELSASEEADPAAVGGPKGESGPVGAGQELVGRSVEGADPELHA